MLSSSLNTLLKVSKTTYPQKLFTYDCVTLYIFPYKFFCKIAIVPLTGRGGGQCFSGIFRIECRFFLTCSLKVIICRCITI